MDNNMINTNQVPKMDYTPLNSIPFSELKIGRKYSFTHYTNKEVEGILMKKDSINLIELKLTKKSGMLIHSMCIGYTKTYLNNVKPVDDKIYKFSRDDLVFNSDDDGYDSDYKNDDYYDE